MTSRSKEEGGQGFWDNCNKDLILQSVMMGGEGQKRYATYIPFTRVYVDPRFSQIDEIKLKYYASWKNLRSITLKFRTYVSGFN